MRIFLTALVLVAAFCSHFLAIPDDSRNGLSRLVAWIDFAGPWFLVALLGGAAYGIFGHRWRAKGSRLAAVLLGVPHLATASCTIPCGTS